MIKDGVRDGLGNGVTGVTTSLGHVPSALEASMLITFFATRP